jgi:hypothetical protein
MIKNLGFKFVTINQLLSKINKTISYLLQGKLMSR